MNHDSDRRSKSPTVSILPFHFNRWMEPLLCAGFCRELEHNDLYAHPSEADSEELLKRFNQ
jgi:hypothetical protein